MLSSANFVSENSPSNFRTDMELQSSNAGPRTVHPPVQVNGYLRFPVFHVKHGKGNPLKSGHFCRRSAP